MMPLALALPLALLALAANSVLVRWAVVDFAADPGLFAIVRVASGAAVLGLLAGLRRRPSGVAPWRLGAGALALATYMIGFSLAYRSLDTGLGALLLFGWVQVSIFAILVVRGLRPPALHWLGAAVAFAGLAWLLAPDGSQREAEAVDLILMSGAGIAWGLYTLLGRGAGDPVTLNAASFALCLPLVLPLWAFASGGLAGPALWLAVLSGAVTSGLGYALWYAIVPRLEPAVTGVAQLSVPVIATFGGVLFVGEAVTLKLIFGAALVLGGIGLSLLPDRRAKRSGAAT